MHGVFQNVTKSYFCYYESILFQVHKTFPVFHVYRVITDYLAVKVNFPEFGKYSVIG